MKRAVVFGGAGFIGRHLVARLCAEGYWVRVVDRHVWAHPECEFVLGDLRVPEFVASVVPEGIDELYQLAAEMGGAGFIFTGDNDARIVHDSAQINLLAADIAQRRRVRKLFFSSSACVYPSRNQTDPNAPECREDTVYPAEPDSEYGWEKLFAERLYAAYARNYGLDVRIARFHNIYGPGNAFSGGREKAPGALCRKVAEAHIFHKEELEIWGDGEQTRSFLYIDDCIDGIRALMQSNNYNSPVNIGSEHRVALHDFARLVSYIAGCKLRLKFVPGPVGVRGRTSNNEAMYRLTGWEPRVSLGQGMTATYDWVFQQMAKL